MKKIVALGCAAALVSGLAFAGEPASNPSVAEFTGSASVEWGVNLDTKKTGFKNEESASFKMKLFDTGTKETSGEGVWAELKIKIEDDDGVGPNGVNNGAPKWKAAAVDAAMIHVDDFYVGIRSGDVQTGELDITTALRAPGFWQNPGRWLTNVGPANSQGIVVGYGNSNFSLEADLRTVAHYDDKYAVAAEAKLKDSNEWVAGLEAKAGVSIDLDSNDLSYSGSAAYKFAIDDTYYVKPAAGITVDADDVKTIAGGVIFGWGGTNGYGSVGVPYFGDDQSRGVTPGISVVAKKVLDVDGIVIAPSFYLGDLVENLKAAAYGEICIPETDGVDPVYAFGAGVAYDIKSDDVTVTAKAGMRYAVEDYVAIDKLNVNADGEHAGPVFVPGQTCFFDNMGTDAEKYFNLTIGADIAGLINNTTFYVLYTSDNLMAEDGDDVVKLGTCNVGCKISF